MALHTKNNTIFVAELNVVTPELQIQEIDAHNWNLYTKTLLLSDFEDFFYNGEGDPASFGVRPAPANAERDDHDQRELHRAGWIVTPQQTSNEQVQYETNYYQFGGRKDSTVAHAIEGRGAWGSAQKPAKRVTDGKPYDCAYFIGEVYDEDGIPTDADQFWAEEVILNQMEKDLGISKDQWTASSNYRITSELELLCWNDAEIAFARPLESLETAINDLKQNPAILGAEGIYHLLVILVIQNPNSRVKNNNLNVHFRIEAEKSIHYYILGSQCDFTYDTPDYYGLNVTIQMRDVRSTKWDEADYYSMFELMDPMSLKGDHRGPMYPAYTNVNTSFYIDREKGKGTGQPNENRYNIKPTDAVAAAAKAWCGEGNEQYPYMHNEATSSKTNNDGCRFDGSVWTLNNNMSRSAYGSTIVVNEWTKTIAADGYTTTYTSTPTPYEIRALNRLRVPNENVFVNSQNCELRQSIDKGTNVKDWAQGYEYTDWNPYGGVVRHKNYIKNRFENFYLDSDPNMEINTRRNNNNQRIAATGRAGEGADTSVPRLSVIDDCFSPELEGKVYVPIPEPKQGSLDENMLNYGKKGAGLWWFNTTAVIHPGLQKNDKTDLFFKFHKLGKTIKTGVNEEATPFDYPTDTHPVMLPGRIYGFRADHRGDPRAGWFTESNFVTGVNSEGNEADNWYIVKTPNWYIPGYGEIGYRWGELYGHNFWPYLPKNTKMTENQFKYTKLDSKLNSLVNGSQEDKYWRYSMGKDSGEADPSWMKTLIASGDKDFDLTPEIHKHTSTPNPFILAALKDQHWEDVSGTLKPMDSLGGRQSTTGLLNPDRKIQIWKEDKYGSGEFYGLNDADQYVLQLSWKLCHSFLEQKCAWDIPEYAILVNNDGDNVKVKEGALQGLNPPFDNALKENDVVRTVNVVGNCADAPHYWGGNGGGASIGAAQEFYDQKNGYYYIPAEDPSENDAKSKNDMSGAVASVVGGVDGGFTLPLWHWGRDNYIDNTSESLHSSLIRNIPKGYSYLIKHEPERGYTGAERRNHATTSISLKSQRTPYVNGLTKAGKNFEGLAKSNCLVYLQENDPEIEHILRAMQEKQDDAVSGGHQQEDENLEARRRMTETVTLFKESTEAAEGNGWQGEWNLLHAFGERNQAGNVNDEKSNFDVGTTHIFSSLPVWWMSGTHDDLYGSGSGVHKSLDDLNLARSFCLPYVAMKIYLFYKLSNDKKWIQIYDKQLEHEEDPNASVLLKEQKNMIEACSEINMRYYTREQAMNKAVELGTVKGRAWDDAKTTLEAKRNVFETNVAKAREGLETFRSDTAAGVKTFLDVVQDISAAAHDFAGFRLPLDLGDPYQHPVRGHGVGKEVIEVLHEIAQKVSEHGYYEYEPEEALTAKEFQDHKVDYYYGSDSFLALTPGEKYVELVEKIIGPGYEWFDDSDASGALLLSNLEAAEKLFKKLRDEKDDVDALLETVSTSLSAMGSHTLNPGTASTSTPVPKQPDARYALLAKGAWDNYSDRITEVIKKPFTASLINAQVLRLTNDGVNDGVPVTNHWTDRAGAENKIEVTMTATNQSGVWSGASARLHGDPDFNTGAWRLGALAGEEEENLIFEFSKEITNFTIECDDFGNTNSARFKLEVNDKQHLFLHRNFDKGSNQNTEIDGYALKSQDGVAPVAHWKYTIQSAGIKKIKMIHIRSNVTSPGNAKYFLKIGVDANSKCSQQQAARAELLENHLLPAMPGAPGQVHTDTQFDDVSEAWNALGAAAREEVYDHLKHCGDWQWGNQTRANDPDNDSSNNWSKATIDWFSGMSGELGFPYAEQPLGRVGLHWLSTPITEFAEKALPTTKTATTKFDDPEKIKLVQKFLEKVQAEAAKERPKNAVITFVRPDSSKNYHNYDDAAKVVFNVEKNLRGKVKGEGIWLLLGASGETLTTTMFHKGDIFAIGARQRNTDGGDEVVENGRTIFEITEMEAPMTSMTISSWTDNGEFEGPQGTLPPHKRTNGWGDAIPSDNFTWYQLVKVELLVFDEGGTDAVLELPANVEVDFMTLKSTGEKDKWFNGIGGGDQKVGEVNWISTNLQKLDWWESERMEDLSGAVEAVRVATGVLSGGALAGTPADPHGLGTDWNLWRTTPMGWFREEPAMRWWGRNTGGGGDGVNGDDHTLAFGRLQMWAAIAQEAIIQALAKARFFYILKLEQMKRELTIVTDVIAGNIENKPDAAALTLTFKNIAEKLNGVEVRDLSNALTNTRTARVALKINHIRDYVTAVSGEAAAFNEALEGFDDGKFPSLELDNKLNDESWTTGWIWGPEQHKKKYQKSFKSWFLDGGSSDGVFYRETNQQHKYYAGIKIFSTFDENKWKDHLDDGWGNKTFQSITPINMAARAQVADSPKGGFSSKAPPEFVDMADARTFGRTQGLEDPWNIDTEADFVIDQNVLNFKSREKTEGIAVEKEIERFTEERADFIEKHKNTAQGFFKGFMWYATNFWYHGLPSQRGNLDQDFFTSNPSRMFYILNDSHGKLWPWDRMHRMTSYDEIMFKQALNQFDEEGNSNNKHLQYIDTTIHPGLQGSWFDYLYGAGEWKLTSEDAHQYDWWFGYSITGNDELDAEAAKYSTDPSNATKLAWNSGPYTLYPWDGGEGGTSQVYIVRPKPNVIYYPTTATWLKSVHTEMRPGRHSVVDIDGLDHPSGDAVTETASGTDIKARVVRSARNWKQMNIMGE